MNETEYLDLLISAYIGLGQEPEQALFNALETFEQTFKPSENIKHN